MMNTTTQILLKSLRENFNLEEEDDIFEELGNTTSAYAGGEGPQRTPYAFSKKSDEEKKRKKFGKPSAVYQNPVEATNRWFVKVEQTIRNLDEASYKDYRADETQTSRQKINSTIKEINKRLSEVEKMINHSKKLKLEIGADNSVFYSDTIRRFQKITERLNRISAKIREYNS